MNETNKQGYERSEQTRIRVKRVSEFHLLLKYVNIFLQIYQFLERSKQTRVGAKRNNKDTSETSSPECKGCIGDSGGALGAVPLFLQPLRVQGNFTTITRKNQTFKPLQSDTWHILMHFQKNGWAPHQIHSRKSFLIGFCQFIFVS